MSPDPAFAERLLWGNSFDRMNRILLYCSFRKSETCSGFCPQFLNDLENPGNGGRRAGGGNAASLCDDPF